MAVAPGAGVKVAVQVMPPSAVARLLNVPLVTRRSLTSKPVTASEKVMVTVARSPAFSAVSLRVIAAVGR